MKRDFIFTSESVTQGHPDKLCDQISDAVIDRYLARDPLSQVIAECALAGGVMFVASRFASSVKVDLADVAREVLREAGYDGNSGFNADDCTVLTSLQELGSRDFDCLDERQMDEKALDRFVAFNQVNSFGFACEQTPSLMPLPISLSHALVRHLDQERAAGNLPGLQPDGQAQVSIQYRDGRPWRVHGISMLASHDDRLGREPGRLESFIREQVLAPVLSDFACEQDAQTQVSINPYGPILGGGPKLHAGLTGRKNGMDTYGEYSRHSGAALSGKDPTRIDRVGAYMARYAAKNVVAAGLARQCEVQLTYAIGQARPVSVQLDTFDTASIAEEELLKRVEAVFDFRLGAILRDLGLRRLPAAHPAGFYRRLAVYGHVGREDLELPWERTDRADALLG